MNDLYLIIGFTHTPWIGLGIGSILLAGSLLILSIPAYVIMLKLNEVFRLERKTKKPATKEERDTYSW